MKQQNTCCTNGILVPKNDTVLLVCPLYLILIDRPHVIVFHKHG